MNNIWFNDSHYLLFRTGLCLWCNSVIIPNRFFDILVSEISIFLECSYKPKKPILCILLKLLQFRWSENTRQWNRTYVFKPNLFPPCFCVQTPIQSSNIILQLRDHSSQHLAPDPRSDPIFFKSVVICRWRSHAKSQTTIVLMLLHLSLFGFGKSFHFAVSVNCPHLLFPRLYNYIR